MLLLSDILWPTNESVQVIECRISIRLFKLNSLQQISFLAYDLAQ